jgi:peptidoglycan/xylan/chitin deacetylase (PgdA/CDA1 family)
MDNGCLPTAPLCTAADYSMTNVSQHQFYDELNWLYSHGYRTVTTDQYVKWSAGQHVLLPAKPVLLTVDDGIANFYAGATPVLRHFAYTMVSMVVSGFAQAATDGDPAYKGWDATWTQLRNLPADTWEFAFHAGPRGHAATGASCPYFYSCQRPGESAAAFQERIAADIDQGIAAEKRELGDRVNTTMWAVPFNDLAQDPGEPQSGAEPARWLQEYAAKRFAVVFVDGTTTRTGQYYRYEVHGPDSLAFFGQQVELTDVYTRFPSPATATAREGGQS